MGIKANFFNLIYFIGRLAPMMMVFFFTLSSIINKDWRGVIYLSGIIISCFITILFSNTIESYFAPPSQNTNFAVCSFTEKEYSKLPLSSVIIGFTIMYLILPMIKTYGSINNKLLFLILLIFIGVDVIFLIRNKCSALNIIPVGSGDFINTLIPILLSYSIGFFIGQIYVLILNSTGNGNLLYYNDSTTKPLCNVTKSNKFTCKVYKNGELVTQ